MTAVSTGRLPVGTVLDDRYEVGPLLGRGGMSDVHRARDRVTGQDVAVKVFRDGVEMLDAEARRRREAKVALALKHPGLVRLLDARPGDDGPAYLVMELMDGQTLGQAVRHRPCAEAAVVRMGAALCAALAYVHARGVIHRDVKPANVLLASDGSPRLADFGVARVVDSTRMTVEGFTVGTANYLSPEQVTGQDVDPASDVYSLGLVLIEALTGELVYPGHGVEAALARLHRDPAPPAGISPELADLLTAMTAREPAHRPSADQARRRFEELVGDTGPVPFTAGAEPPRRRRAAVSLGLVGSVAAATVAVVLALSPDGAPTGSHPAVDPTPAVRVAPVASSASPTTKAVVAARPVGSERIPPVLRRDAGAALLAAVAHRSASSSKPVVKKPAPAGHHGHGHGKKK